MIFARLGANDPDFNLRRDPAFILRRENTKSTLFASVLESHGTYNPVREIPEHPFGSIQNVTPLYGDAEYSIVSFETKGGREWVFMMANQNASTDAQHHVQVGEKTFEWRGVYALEKK